MSNTNNTNISNVNNNANNNADFFSYQVGAFGLLTLSNEAIQARKAWMKAHPEASREEFPWNK